MVIERFPIPLKLWSGISLALIAFRLRLLKIIFNLLELKILCGDKTSNSILTENENFKKTLSKKINVILNCLSWIY